VRDVVRAQRERRGVHAVLAAVAQRGDRAARAAAADERALAQDEVSRRSMHDACVFDIKVETVFGIGHQSLDAVASTRGATRSAGGSSRPGPAR
jgi:hypothetical protein